MARVVFGLALPTDRRSLDAAACNETGPSGGTVRRSDIGTRPDENDDTNPCQHYSGHA